jgi:uncharacterized Zn finger protein
LPRFDVDTLREIAGEAAFARGKEYFHDQRVDITSIDAARVAASVSGSEVYAAELKGAGKQFSGKCTCPAFDDWGFCKHLVATGLAANALSADEIASASDHAGRMRGHLVARGAEALADMILRIAERDVRLRSQLELAAAAERDDDAALSSRLKKAVTNATRIRDYVEYGEVGEWVEAVRDVLDQIDALIQAGRASATFGVLDHLFSRLETTLESIDDSDGEVGGLFASAREIHLAACEKAMPDPVDLARQLFDREVHSDWDSFDGASVDYAGVLGEAGLAEYRSLAEEAWRKIKPLAAGSRRVHDEDSSARYRLGQILEGFAERDGDVDARIAIRSKDLSSPYAYLGIAQLCLDSGREAEALKWAEDGLFLFEDHPDERLILFVADLHHGAGRTAEANAVLLRSFEQEPSMELYRRINAFAGGNAAATEAVRDRALARLRAGVEKPTEARPLWTSVELLLTFLIDERLLAEAWAVVRTHRCSEPLIDRLAAASEESHPAEALDAHARRVERLIGLGGNGNYEGACKIIRRMAPIRHRLGAADQHAAYLAELMKRHKAKRNFVKLLAAIK